MTSQNGRAGCPAFHHSGEGGSMNQSQLEFEKVDVSRCESCGADRGGVVTREGKRDRFLCFKCNAAVEGGEVRQAE